MQRRPDGTMAQLTEAPLNVRSRVHEMGGGAASVAGGTVYFSNFSDNGLYRRVKDGTPEPITPSNRSRYAEPLLDLKRDRLICVREDPAEGVESTNLLASVPLDGSEESILVSGADFYSTPRLSPDGAKLAWLSWNHPNMPWMGTELWVGELDFQGAIIGQRCVAGSPDESIFQPEWSPEGLLTFISDRSGWWNLYGERAGKSEALFPMEAEFARAQWVLGMSAYAFISANKLVCTYTQRGVGHLAVLDTTTGSLTNLHLPYTEFGQVRYSAGSVFALAGSPTEPISLIGLDLKTSKLEVIRRSLEPLPENTVSHLSHPQFVEFPSGGETVFAWYYPPKNPDYQPLPGEKPPPIVRIHGGPTGNTSSSLSLRNAYWTSRGYAVIDVDYRGSTGYGRAYRNALRLQWGVVDLEDSCNAAQYLAAQGLADGRRAIITGGSAGGFTTLGALTFTDVFRAGMSHYGISDLEGLLEDTHKFESHYTYWLVGDYPKEQETYRARSPIHFAEKLSVPIIFFQGEDDKIVLPNQAERMVEVLQKKGLPVRYFLFPGEGHGFRKAENIIQVLEAELDFCTSILFPTQPTVGVG
jgi:acetyl esterase/lipase